MISWLSAPWKREFTQTWLYWISDFQPPYLKCPSFLKKRLPIKLHIKLVYKIQVLKTGKLASSVPLWIHRHTFERFAVLKFLLPCLPDPWDLLSSGRQQYFIKMAFSTDGFNLAISKQSLPPPFTWPTADTHTSGHSTFWSTLSPWFQVSKHPWLSTSWGTLPQSLFLYSFPFSELFVVETSRAQSLDSCALSCHPSFDDSTEVCAFEHHICMACLSGTLLSSVSMTIYGDLSLRYVRQQPKNDLWSLYLFKSYIYSTNKTFHLCLRNIQLK